MKVRMGSLLVLGAIGSGCGPGLMAEAEWVHWFSDRIIMDGVDTPQGDTIVVGRSASNELSDEPGHHHLDIARPFIARVDEDGDLLHEWEGYLGEATSVAIDSEGRAYVLVEGLRDTPDFAEPARCEVWALDLEGEVRWTADWPDGEFWDCPRDVVMADDVLVVNLRPVLEGLDLDGNLAWRSGSGPTIPVRMVPDGDVVWWARNTPEGGSPVAGMSAHRVDVHSGLVTDVELDMRDASLGDFRPLDGGLLAIAFTGLDPTEPTDIRLVSFASDGSVRWNQRVALAPAHTEPYEGWVWSWLSLTEQGAPWIVGSERLLGAMENPRLAQHRLIAQRWSADGTREGTMRHAFTTVEPGTPLEGAEDLDLLGCHTSDAAIRGSWSYQGLSRDDSVTFLGRQNCRDSFVLKMEVPW